MQRKATVNENHMLQSRFDVIFNWTLNAVFLIFCITTLYPFLNVLAKSFSNGKDIIGKRVGILPIGFTWANYQVIFSDRSLLGALYISAARTVIGTISSLAVMVLAAYSMSKRSLRGRKWLMIFLLVPMYFGGGLIPTYVNIIRLKLNNNFLVYILPGMFTGFNFLLIMSYITQLPGAYEESAMIDGASHPQIVWRLIVPLCKPVLATIALFCAVGHWNAWFDALMYVNKASLQPLQLVLQIIIRERSMDNLIKAAQYNASDLSKRLDQFTPETISMATMIFTVVPILCVYPFLQKYFVTGITLGGIKG